ncbi:hypothetical protein SDC9_159173 [bioreactor metagenome]|uniref:Uncharacterized protein n=1 Tax=bioreactor metagenome TaxID=1076179 RepID=A0A645FBX4_9ZZZZ
MHSRYGNGFSQAQLVKLIIIQLAIKIFHLIGSQDYRFFAFAQQIGHLLILVADSILCIHHQNDDIRFFYRQFCLQLDLACKNISVIKANAARIYNDKLPSLPVRTVIEAVTGNAGYILNDSFARPCQPIKQG